MSTLAGHGQIAVVRRGQYVKGRIYSWELNGGRGMSWPAVGTFVANMNFEIVDADPDRHDPREGALRVSTRSYHYHFLEPGTRRAKWRMHWHPTGCSSFTDPHLHRPPDIKVHWPTPRMSFETAIRWCEVEGVPLACDRSQFEDRLTEAESGFRLFRSWQDVTDSGYPSSLGRPS